MPLRGSYEVWICCRFSGFDYEFPAAGASGILNYQHLAWFFRVEFEDNQGVSTESLDKGINFVDGESSVFKGLDGIEFGLPVGH